MPTGWGYLVYLGCGGSSALPGLPLLVALVSLRISSRISPTGEDCRLCGVLHDLDFHRRFPGYFWRAVPHGMPIDERGVSGDTRQQEAGRTGEKSESWADPDQRLTKLWRTRFLARGGIGILRIETVSELGSAGLLYDPAGSSQRIEIGSL